MELIDYIVQIVGMIIPLVILILKINHGNKKNRDIYKEDFRTVQNEVHLLRKDINGILIDRDFRKTLRNTIMDHVSTYAKINHGSSQQIKSILMFWGDEIDALAARWYNSEYRGVKNKKEMIVYLMGWIKGRLSIAKHFINDEIKGVKLTHDRDKKGLLFSEWVEKNNLYAQFEILVGALAKNGYVDQEEILEEFTDFIDKFFELFLALCLSWKTLERKVYEDIS